MNSTILFQTGPNKNYIFNARLNRFLFCHPVLVLLVKLHAEGVDVKQWVGNVNGRNIKIEGHGTFKKSEIAYYYQKFLLLLENGYLSKVENEHHLSGRIKSDDIKSTLANLRQVTFEVTDACNLECAYCGYGKFYDDYDERKNKRLNTDAAKNILTYLTGFWNSHWNRSRGKNIYLGLYGGEPLLNIEFIKELVRFAGDLELKHNRFTFSMTTNAILLEKYMDFLAENECHLLISLDGDAGNNSYRVFHNKKPAYETILKNVLALKTKYPDYFQKKVNFNAVLHNKNSVSDIHNYFRERFDKIPSIGELNTSGINESQKELFLETYSNINESLYQAEDYSYIEKDMFVKLPNIQGLGIFLHKCSGHVFKDYNDLLFSRKNQTRTPTGTCSPFSKKLYVTVNGKILPCERIGHRYALGEVDEEKVTIDFETIARKYNDYYDGMQKRCNHCCFNELCSQCIFYLDLANETPVCSGFMDQKAFSKYLSEYMSYIEKNPGIYSKIMKEVVIE